jgi:hypothetical protein
VSKKRQSYSCNRPWRLIWLWDVEAPTFSRQSAHRWRWGCQPYASAALYSFLLEAESTQGHSVAGRIRSIEKSSDLIGIRIRDLPACSIVLQPTMLPHAPNSSEYLYCAEIGLICSWLKSRAKSMRFVVNDERNFVIWIFVKRGLSA